MPVPSIVLGFAIATLLGAVFHLWKDGGLGKLILYLCLSWVGFYIGHRIADTSGISFLDVGQLHVGLGVVGSIGLLLLGHWLSLIEVQPKGKK
jgi:hypothetical protein